MEGDIAGTSGRIWALIAVSGVILAAAYLLWLYQRVFFGQVNNPKNEGLADLSRRELAYFTPLVILAFWIGLYPKPFFQILEQPVNQIVKVVRPDYPTRAVSAEAAKPAPAEQQGAGTPAAEPQREQR
jgi:NADH-quinone oxidoreductase subunit M